MCCTAVDNPIVNSTHTRIKNNLGIMPNRITTWQPQHQQCVSDTVIFSISEECLHTLIVTHTEFLTYTNTKITPQSSVIKSQTN